MEHVAIMKKSWGLLPKILSGEKKIESRWSRIRCAPWDRVHEGDIVYFRDTGELVYVRAHVGCVIQHANLDPGMVEQILNEYGQRDGLGIDDIPRFAELFRDKRYCTLVFLQNPEKVEQFEINKTGFGMGSAWLVVDNVESLKC